MMPAKKQRALETPRPISEQVDAMVCAFSDATDGKVPGDYTNTPRSALTRRMRGIVGGSLVDVRRKLASGIERLNAIRLATVNPLAPANMARLQRAGDVLDDSGDLADTLNALAFIGDAISERDTLDQVRERRVAERKQSAEDHKTRQTPEAQRHEANNWIEFLIRPEGFKNVDALTEDDRRALVEKFAATLGVST